MPEPRIECGDEKVSGLVAFVSARAEEDRLGAHLKTPADEAVIARCDIVQQVLLDMARETCRPTESCQLPQRCLLSLGEYAFVHKGHRDFDPEWTAWRLLP